MGKHPTPGRDTARNTADGLSGPRSCLLDAPRAGWGLGELGRGSYLLRASGARDDLEGAAAGNLGLSLDEERGAGENSVHFPARAASGEQLAMQSVVQLFRRISELHPPNRLPLRSWPPGSPSVGEGPKRTLTFRSGEMQAKRKQDQAQTSGTLRGESPGSQRGGCHFCAPRSSRHCDISRSATAWAEARPRWSSAFSQSEFFRGAI